MLSGCLNGLLTAFLSLGCACMLENQNEQHRSCLTSSPPPYTHRTSVFVPTARSSNPSRSTVCCLLPRRNPRLTPSSARPFPYPPLPSPHTRDPSAVAAAPHDCWQAGRGGPVRGFRWARSSVGDGADAWATVSVGRGPCSARGSLGGRSFLSCRGFPWGGPIPLFGGFPSPPLQKSCRCCSEWPVGWAALPERSYCCGLWSPCAAPYCDPYGISLLCPQKSPSFSLLPWEASAPAVCSDCVVSPGPSMRPVVKLVRCWSRRMISYWTFSS